MISFIIPTYNGADKIEKCIFSIVKQSTEIDYEVLVIDDGSVDQTAAIVKSIAESYPMIHYFYKENSGVSAARNLGLAKSQGKYIIFLDTDDYLDDLFFEVIDLSDNADLYVYGYHYIDENGKCNSITLNDQKLDKNHGFVDLYNANLFNPVWNKIYKKEKINHTFHDDMIMGEDLMFNLEYLKNVQDIKVIHHALYNYCVNNGSATKNYKFKYIQDFIKIYNELNNLMISMNIKHMQKIESDFVDNIVGSVFMLVNAQMKYSSYKNEMNKIRAQIPQNLLKLKSQNRISQFIYMNLKHQYYLPIYLVIKLKNFVKSLLNK